MRTQEALSQMWWAKLAWALSIASLPPRLVAALAGAALVMAGLPAQGQTESVLYSFDYVDGAHPTGSLVFDAQGNLYGTTDQSASDFGKAFELTPSGAYTVLYSFTGGWKGASPTAGLVRDIDGNLYGTTFQGGHQQCKPYGCGTVFKLHPTGKVGWLHHFNATDGWGPAGGLIRDAKGNLYGTTVYGGTFGSGTVFKVTPARSLRVLHSFLGYPQDGMAPFAGLVRDTRGNFYGTTYYGGGYVCEFEGCGTVFEITREGEEKVLYSFQGADGSHPAASLVLDTQGNLFGTTEYGGAFGYGTVFELSPFGVETVLHHFTGGADGGFPQASLVRDRKGNLYGTTYLGGATTGVCVSVGCGVVFKITPSGEEDVLYNFAGYPNDGSNPVAGLVLDAQGNLYGTTVTGGESASGVVFKITP